MTERRSKEVKSANLELLNKFALERVGHYQNLQIANVTVTTPFYSNEIGFWFGKMMREAGIDDDQIDEVFNLYKNKFIPYGWHKGKGTPEELIESALEIAKLWQVSLDRAPQEVVVEFMKSAGLGVDCSGFVFNVLKYATELSNFGPIEDHLDWVDDEKRNAYQAGVYSFAGNKTRVIEFSQAKPLDLITIRETRNEGDSAYEKHIHVALVLESNNRLVVAQSSIGQTPPGISVTQIDVSGGSPIFSFKPNLTTPWENLHASGHLKFRRLKCLEG